MNNEFCKQCQSAAHIIRRLGFKDHISWGTLGGTVMVQHATHANLSRTIARQETEAEYQRRKTESVAYGIPSNKVKPYGQTVEEQHLQSLCTFYSNELAWLGAGKPTRTTVYMAHPVSGPDFHDNVRNATIWLRYLRRMPQSSLNEFVGSDFQMRPLILCPWLAAIEADEEYPGGREGVIADARDTVMMFDEVWLLGGRITDGMKVEAQTARILRDLTHHGPLPVPFMHAKTTATKNKTSRKRT